MTDILTIADLILGLFLFIVFYIVGGGIRASHIEKEPYYRYFVAGLFVKLVGGIGVCFVYIFYYSGGDTLGYYYDNTCFARLFLDNPWGALYVTFAPVNDDMFYYIFNEFTGWPNYLYDVHAVYVVRLIWPLSLITFNSIIGQTMLLSFLSFLCMWRLYKMFADEFPTLQKELAFAILFIPSVVFWGSGLLKDTITLAAVALFTSALYKILKYKSGYFINIIAIAFASWALIKIKPYIFFALLPGVLMLFARIKLEKVKNRLVRTATTPMILVVAIFFAYMFLKIMGDSLAEYSLDNVLNRAVVSQQELKQDYYRGSSFDIGEFDVSLGGIMRKIPIAITSALFRPFLWESYNPAMIISGLENTVMLIFTIYLLLKLKFINFFRLVFKHPLLFFSFSFSIFFAFSIGLTTSNFGALVRYKIPAIPFFVTSLVITNYYYQKSKKEKKAQKETMDGASKIKRMETANAT